MDDEDRDGREDDLAQIIQVHRSAILGLPGIWPVGNSRATLRIPVRFLRELVASLDSQPNHSPWPTTEWNFASAGGNVLNCKRVTGQNYDSIDFEYNPGD